MSIRASRPIKRGVAHVTNVAAGCGGRGAGRTTIVLISRTAKSCGPGAPMLAFKLATMLTHRAGEGGKKSPVTWESAK